jgi:HEAT repeat protein
MVELFYILSHTLTCKEIQQSKINLLLEKTKYGYDQHLRRTATRLLGQFVREGEGEENINTTVYNRLKELLFDDWVHVRNVACIALGDAFKGTNYTNVIQALEKVAEYDSDGQVRRTALESIRKVKEEVKKQPPMRMITIQDLSKLDLSLRSQETRAMQKRIPTK